MAGDILSIGKSGLYAAQAGLATTGHNITNAYVAGYNRQVVLQSTTPGVETADGTFGMGTRIVGVKRYTNEFLNAQVRTAQASYSGLEAYNAQISQIDNLLADTTSGLSPALQSFFKSVQSVTAQGASTESRGGLLSSAETLAARFQQMDARLNEIRNGVNGGIQSSVALINSYAEQIAELNHQIAGFAPDAGHMPNDLLDKRDQLVMELNKYVKATVMPGDNNSLRVSIGNGQPLVVGNKAYDLVATQSATDQSRIQVGYQTGSKVTLLPENALPGGELGALLDFRANSLDRAQSSLGRIAIGLAHSFNEQHKLGLDADGNQGKDVFAVGGPFIGKNANNNILSTMSVQARVVDPTQLSQSDYKVEFKGGAYVVTRLSDKEPTTITSVPQTIHGIEFTVTGSAAEGDNYLVRPTINGAADFKVLLTSRSEVAAAVPIATSKPLSNKGTGEISAGSVNASYFAAPLGAPMTFTFDGPTSSLDVAPATGPVTVTLDDGTINSYAAGAPVPFTAGATYSVGGMSFVLSGTPLEGDSFKIEPNNGSGDTRNASLLGDLQTKNILDNRKTTFQSAYAELVGFVGNKAREVQVNAEAGEALLKQVTTAAQDVSGVNMDEEATNLIRFQQAYQGAGKIMQIASTIFETLLGIGR